MAYWTNLINAWNSGTQPPAGVKGTALTGGMTTAQKLAAVNAWTVVGPAVPMIIPPAAILNACAVADLQALTTTQLQLLQLLLSGTQVDASAGTTLRAAIVAIFTGKPSLTSLAALATLYDAPQIPWWPANGYTSAISPGDAANAGLS
jgi:hypothetical protein